MRRGTPLHYLLLFSFLVTAVAAGQQSSQPKHSLPKPQSQCTEEKRAGVQLLLARAEQGDSGAQFWLGVAYEEGWCTKSDLKEALRFYTQAAEQGNPDAQNSLGQMYEEGRGVKQDYASAAKWYLKAAEHVPDLGGAGQGRNNLGMLYLQGLGVPKDYVRAYMWFRLAQAEANLSEAKAQMTPSQVLEAEQMAEAWRKTHKAR